MKLQKAQITLNDCLACSGCITSAESILITQQSQDQLYRVLQLNADAIRVSSLAALSLYECFSDGSVSPVIYI